MEILLSAIVSELVRRSISCLIDKHSKQPASEEESFQRLQRVLLRARVAVEEAEGRRITSRAMLQQLETLRGEMHRGYYVLDTFRYDDGNKVKDPEEAGRAFAPSRFNPAKRVYLSVLGGGTRSMEEVHRVLDNLNKIVSDSGELVVFLKNCPPLYRQPYSVHLFMDKCMFGRQMEMERVVGFLLQTSRQPPSGTENFDVLPIVGPGWVGKSTLVEHVCINERVRNHFSRIVWYSEGDLKDESLTTALTDGGVTKYRNSAAFGGNGRLLVIIELTGDDDEGLRRMLHSTSKSNGVPGGIPSKVIITSRHDKIASFGTTQALTLKPLSPEAFWYFFKVVTFGSADPEEQPKLAAIAMEIAKELNGNFLAGNAVAEVLRANVSVQSWSRHLRFIRERVQKHLLLFGEHMIDLWWNGRSIYVRRMAANTGEDCLVTVSSYCDSRTAGLGNEEEGQAAPARRPCKIITSFHELLLGSAVPPRGRFELLGWKSHVPPCYDYLFSCEIQKPEEGVLVRNRKHSRSHHQKIT